MFIVFAVRVLSTSSQYPNRGGVVKIRPLKDPCKAQYAYVQVDVQAEKQSGKGVSKRLS